jgi:RHS repeat-associated protein
MNQTPDTGNHLSSYSYDAAGNMLTDGINSWTYVYDAENRITTAGGAAYTYDADGRRVKKSSGTNYWYGPSGAIMAETDSSGNWTNYIFFGGQRLARNVSGDIKYYITDHLHSTAMFVDKAGTAAAILDDNDFYPWGGLVPGVGKTTSNNHYKMTGKERDTESGLDYYGARYYGSGMGRFMSPDWAAKPATVPYAEFGDPQSLNLYSFTRNSPIIRVDGDGHDANGMMARPGQAGILGAGNGGLATTMWGDFVTETRSAQVTNPDGSRTTISNTVTYQQGTSSQPAQQQNGDVAAAKRYLSGSKEMRAVLKAFESGHFHLEIIHDGNDRYDPATRTVYWDPHSALQTTAGGHQTPALGLGHEMAHATGNRHNNAVLSNTPDQRYDTKEERRVIRNYENPAARELGESPRYNHAGTPYNVACPTCQ